MRTANAKQPAVNSKTGVAWTEAEKQAYAQAQQAGFEVLMGHFRGKGAKSRMAFPARVLEFSDEPYEKTETIEGVTTVRPVSDVKVELTQPGCEGLRFVMSVTDRPNTIQNTGSALNHLYCAATHRQVKEFGVFQWNPQDIIGKEVFAVIQKGNPRSDGARGGYWSELKDFEEMVPDTAVPAAAPAPAPKKAKARPAPDPEVPADDVDDVPF